MIHEARDGVCGGDAVRDELGSRGMHVNPVPSCGSSSRDSSRSGVHWDAVTCLAGLENRTGRPSFPLLSSAVFVGHDEFRLCRGQLRPAERLGVDAQTLLSQQRSFSPSVRSFCVCGERSCAHTKPAAVFFKWTLREPEKRRTKLRHSLRSVFIKNIFTSIVRSACFRG